MEKTIKIGTEEILFKSTAATPIKYNMAFPASDFFKDLNSLSEGNMDATIIQKAMYVMCNHDKNETFEKWLEKFELADMFDAIPEIAELLAGSIETHTPQNSKNV